MDKIEEKARELFPDLESLSDSISKFSQNEVNKVSRDAYVKGYEDGYSDALDSSTTDDDKKPKGKKGY